MGHWRSGNVDLRTAAFFGVVAMAGAYIGARLAVLLTGAVQLSLLAVVMLGLAGVMLLYTVVWTLATARVRRSLRPQPEVAAA